MIVNMSSICHLVISELVIEFVFFELAQDDVDHIDTNGILQPNPRWWKQKWKRKIQHKAHLNIYFDINNSQLSKKDINNALLNDE